MKSVYDIFQERGFIEQITDEPLIKEQLAQGGVTCYIGFDPTGASLHVGHLIPVMALAHLQRNGHRTIALVGGGTALIGDPSGKIEMRRILTREQIEHNAQGIQKQLARYLEFGDGKASLLNNADWLTGLNYIEFLRDIGRHFSVNRMLAAESYRMRLEKGLNFIEFNYMLLQAYDFLHLFKEYSCRMQMGGNDQWGNMVAGIDLIRRVEGAQAFSMTFPLITTSQGHKMGKTEKGTVWLDGELTSPYEYYQYWINVEDADVARFLALFTFLPVDEVAVVKTLLSDARLNMAKAVLAFEATKITHGEEAALAAWKSSASTFGVRLVEDFLFPSSTIPRLDEGMDRSAMPILAKSRSELAKGIPAYELFQEGNLCVSRGEARRLIAQGGGYVNDRQLKAFDELIRLEDADDQGEILLRKGKKKYLIIQVR
ncbi:MAG: tyrosine--tRNA ligase [Syntrophaceae bacterium]|nr:tyrosine--tRNA ligase [Syntrophaceae bacterium]